MKLVVRALKYPHVVYGRIYGAYRTDNPTQPLFIIAPSAALLAKGIHELGIYAGVDFPSNMHVGAYGGDVLGKFKNQAEAAASEVATREEAAGNSMLLVRKTRDGAFELINGRTMGPPYLCLCNDPRGTRAVENLRSTEFGSLYTTKKIPGFDTDATIYANLGSELLWSYGNTYWKVPKFRGTESTPPPPPPAPAPPPAPTTRPTKPTKPKPTTRPKSTAKPTTKKCANPPKDRTKPTRSKPANPRAAPATKKK